MGIRFYGLEESARVRWDAFIKSMESTSTVVYSEEGEEDEIETKVRVPEEAPAEEVCEDESVEVEPLVIIDPGAETTDVPAKIETPRPPLVADDDEHTLVDSLSFHERFPDELDAPTVLDPVPSELAMVHGAEPGLAPKEAEGHIVYRIASSTIRDLLSFCDSTLQSKGLLMKTEPRPPEGTPAVVVVTHPERGEELHLTGDVVPSPEGCEGVALSLSRVPESTALRAFVKRNESNRELEDDTDLHTFVQRGHPCAASDGAAPEWENTVEVAVEDVSAIHEK
jgi:hypothetical protein